MRKIEETKRVYRIIPDFNINCKNCSLKNGAAIGGHTFGKVNEIQLIIVAAYPAREEIKKGYSLASNKVQPNIDRPNAGRYIYYSSLLFDQDPDIPNKFKPFYNHIGFTNMIKCTPFSRTGDKLTVSDKHIRTCKQTWLEKEIYNITIYNPTCPILLCGSEAAKLLSPKQKVYSSRRRIYTYANTHPVLITFNPVEVVRYTAQKITEHKITTKNKFIVEKVTPQKPIIIGSPSWHWRKDINTVKDLVKANYLYKQSNFHGNLKDYTTEDIEWV